MNKSSAKDCFSIQYSYKISGLEFRKDRALIYNGKCTSCNVHILWGPIDNDSKSHLCFI